jgi:hypothetical protein
MVIGCSRSEDLMMDLARGGMRPSPNSTDMDLPVVA